MSRKWTDDEKQRLKDAWSEYLASDPRPLVREWQAEIADELDRSPTAIRNKRDDLGLLLDSGGAQPKVVHEDDTPEPVDDTKTDLLPYHFVPGEDGEDGTYLFHLEDGICPIEESTWEYICQEYSERGANRTCKEIAIEVGIAYPDLRRCLRKAGQFKKSLPFSQEALKREPEDELVARSLVAKERRIGARAQRAHVKRMEREWREIRAWRDSEERFLEAACRIVGERKVPSVERLDLPSDDEGEDWIAHVPTTDEHVGLRVWGDAGYGDHYDTDIAAARLRAHADATAEWIASQPGRCVRVYRTFLGDLFHALYGETVHGTPLEQDTRTAKVWDAALDAIEYTIQRLRRVADEVVVAYAPGNHDGEDDLHKLFRTLEREYRPHDDVTVHVHPSKSWSFRAGATLHVIDHGYGVSKVSGYKAKMQAENVARQQGDAFHGAEWIYTYYGHKHEKAVARAGPHHEIVRLDALCEADDFASEHRFSSRPCAIAQRLDAVGREDRRKTIYLDALTGREATPLAGVSAAGVT